PSNQSPPISTYTAAPLLTGSNCSSSHRSTRAKASPTGSRWWFGRSLSSSTYWARRWSRKIRYVLLLSELTDMSRNTERTGGRPAGRCNRRRMSYLEIMAGGRRVTFCDLDQRGQGACPRPIPIRGSDRLAGASEMVVRRLPGDLHVVRVGLPEPALRNAHELRPRAQFLDVPATAVAHAAAQPADELEDHIRDRPLVGHAPLDPLGHELARGGRVLLEVAVRRTLLHGAERAHAAHGLVAPAL